MFKTMFLALLAGASCLGAGLHQAAAIEVEVVPGRPRVVYADPTMQRSAASMQEAYAERSAMGGGFIEFLFGDGPDRGERYQQQPGYRQQPYEQQRLMPMAPYRQQEDANNNARPSFDPKFEKQPVEYHGRESAGTIVIDTPNKFLYLVQGGGLALRYGIGVGRPGFTWAGVTRIGNKREWPDWTPPAEMLKRRPDLPRHMKGGIDNPLGARAMYLGGTLYRIHGSNEADTIGEAVSSGCIRMTNDDVTDLYNRAKIGATVVVEN